jgi:hypothetical protein
VALWRATITKSSTIFKVSWSNVYAINAFDAFNALEICTNIMEVERAVSYNTVSFDKVHVMDEGDHARTRTSPLTGHPGLLDPTGLGGPLPLFCTVRAIFVNLEGKPEQKYLRLGANESNLTLGQWDGEFADFVKDNYVDPLVAMTEYVGPTNEAHVGGSVSPLVQNRQLGWHRRSRPGFKRGWVPA